MRSVGYLLGKEKCINICIFVFLLLPSQVKTNFICVAKITNHNLLEGLKENLPKNPLTEKMAQAKCRLAPLYLREGRQLYG